MVIANGLSDEFVKRVAELERAEGAQVATLVQVAELEDVVRVLRFERGSDAEIPHSGSRGLMNGLVVSIKMFQI